MENRTEEQTCSARGIMKVTKVVQTFKDGILTSSKKVEVAPAINPETSKKQNTPKHHKVLDLGDAALLDFRNALDGQEKLMVEVRNLRRQLVNTENQVKARTREREALKKALRAKQNKITYLLDEVDELGAKLAASQDDNKFLTGKGRELIKKLNQIGSEKTLSSANPPTNSSTSSAPFTSSAPSTDSVAGIDVPSPEALLDEDKEIRAIAAKPIKKGLGLR